MVSTSLKRFAIAASLLALPILALVGCAEGAGTSSGAASSGDVAAVVNGMDIMEEDVTDYVESLRANYFADDDVWADYLVQMGMDPASLREQVIKNYFVPQKLLMMAAEEEGIEATDEEVDEQIAKMRANFPNDEAWQSALDEAGLTEDEWRDAVRESIVNSKLRDKIVADSEGVTDEKLLETVRQYAATFSGAKRSSHILFSLEDEETAQSVLDQINAGTLSFEDAVSEYSIDGSASNGGDVGWDMLPGSSSSVFVAEYQEALDQLELDQMSGLVQSQFGYHIIKCTEIYTAPENTEDITSLDQVPSVLVDYLRSMLESSAENDAYTEWLNAYEEDMDLVVNPMPEGLSYDVDLSEHQHADESASSDESGLSVEVAESSANAAADGEAAAGAEAEADAESEAGDEAEAEG